jgi:hypothetical protein
MPVITQRFDKLPGGDTPAVDHNPKLRFSPLWASSIRSSFPLKLKFNLFKIAFALMFYFVWPFVLR